MASLGSEPGGRRRILVVGRDGRRRTVRLGRMSLKSARTALAHVEALAAARISGAGIPAATAQWLGELPLPIYKRLVKAGLCEPRPEEATLGEFLASYVESRGDVKSSTRQVYGHTRRCLLAHFGERKPLASITRADAAAFAEALRAQGLAENTARRRCGLARQFLTAAIKRGLVSGNPFDAVPVTVGANHERQHFITREDFQPVLDVAPTATWRLALALCRYGGLRCTSEVVLLKWGDVNWERRRFVVTSPKTARYEGRGERVVPIFTELEPYFLDAFEAASEGEVYCCPQFKHAPQMYRKALLNMLQKAAVKPWPKLFQNLRASRATELFTEYPAHVAGAWLGHSPLVALKHYLQTPESYFHQAAGVETPSEKPAQNPAQYTPARGRKDSQPQKPDTLEPAYFRALRPDASRCSEAEKELVGVTGLEPVTSCV